MEALLGDVRYAARILWKAKGLSFVAIASLAIGIGANSAIFTLVNSVLLRPRAVSQPERLVQLYVGDRRSPWETTSYPSYLDLRERGEIFTGLAAYGLGWQFALGGADGVEQVWGEVVSGNYFDVLGVLPHLGRAFLPEEDEVPGRNPVVVLGHGLWLRRFAADSGIIGTAIMLNGQALTVVGVAPPSHTGMMSGWSSEVWVPAMVAPLLDPERGQRNLTSRGNRWVTMIGRLRPGVTIEQAQSRAAILTREMQAAQPGEWMRQREDGSVRELFISVLPERETRVHPGMRSAAWALAALLFAMVDLVLVMACINLAGMFFARAVARRGEIAVRLAIGASRARIVRQLLTESVMLSLVAGVMGAVLAQWALSALMAYMPAMPEGIRVAFHPRPDWRVLAYTIAFALATGVLFGLAPALHASRGSLSAVLKDDPGVSARHRRSRLRTSLVVSQVALSLLLSIGAGLVLRSLEKVRPTRLGFASDRYVVAPIGLRESRYDRGETQQFFERLGERMATVPGVRRASLVDGMPGGFMSRTRRGIEIEGRAESIEIDASIVSAGYFTNMRVPVVAGRDFDAGDREGAPCVAIVNEALAQQYLGSAGSALGKHLYRGSGTDGRRTACRIVGVVRDAEWQSLNREVRPFFAMPVLQGDQRRMMLFVEASSDPEDLLPAVRQVLRELEPDMPLTDVQTLADYFDVTAYPFRLFGLVMAGCGLMALLLAIVGVYGTIAYSVAQRRREVGIRIALGAVRSDILRLVVGQGMVLVAIGLGVGLVLSAALTRVLTSLPLDMELLFGVSATDAITFAGVTVLLGLVALGACWVPAIKAAKVDPLVSLRQS